MAADTSVAATVGQADDLAGRCAGLLVRIGLIGDASAIAAVEPLTGGVSSDIARVFLAASDGTQGDAVCVKFALPQLRVAADWRAPVHRNAAEYRWIEFARTVEPSIGPRLLGRDAEAHGFAMEAVEGPDVVLWKTELLAGRSDGAEATRVMQTLARIHAASAGPDFEREGFGNRDDFHAIRIEPYLLATARAHPALAAPLERMADALYRSDTALVHGDVSPKNILLRSGGPVLLDAECATMGDPAFDVAFLLNHLVLKAIHLRDARLLDAAAGALARYRNGVDWEGADALEARAAALLPMLMLARVDGKSPVEYLDEPSREKVRLMTGPMIASAPDDADAVLDATRRLIKEHE